MKRFNFLLVFCFVFAYIPNMLSGESLDRSKRDLSFETVENGLLEVVNNSDEDLVFFAGALEKGNLLGGIHARTTRKFDYTPFLSNKKGVFMCRAVRLNDFRNKGRLFSGDELYSHIVLYGENVKTSIVVPTEIGGDGVIYLSNHSDSFICEVLLNSPSGKVLTTIMPFTSNKRIYVQFDARGRGYRLFARFVYYDAENNKIATTIPSECVIANPELEGSMIIPIEFFATRAMIKSFSDVNVHDGGGISLDLEE